ncbi:hypothetical protein HZA87_06075 [Candidatus Uhrbacteria bacterium]|nr:hypothetical protein [Candidatus Uhrbacteria bacterium]
MRLHSIFFISIPIFIAHGIEEYLTGFAEIDSIFAFVFQAVLKMSVANGAFVVFQIMFWLLLVMSAFLLLGEHWQRRLLIIPGILYIFEIHHLIEAVLRWEYYPGLFTAFAFPLLAFFFWKERLHPAYQSARI